MQKKLIVLTILCITAVLSIGASASPTHVQLATLIDNSKEYEGKLVEVKGEAIGEVMERGDYSWINITDTTNAIGIWLKSEDAKTVSFFGDYKHRGDTVNIIGIYHKACKEHGGEVDIHAVSLGMAERGNMKSESISGVKIIGTISLTSFGLAAGLVFYRKMKTSNG